MPADPPATPPSRPPLHSLAPVVIGLMGGVAAGKSTVAAAFAAHGLAIVDADAIARGVVEQPEVLAQLAEAFGPGVLDAKGRLVRSKLAEIVFADGAARRRLEAVTHPRIRTVIEARLAAAKAANRSVLLDAPLLLEHGLIDRCDVTVFVEASEELRARRARERGWNDAELERRDAAQAPLPVKKARATYTIANDGPMAETARQVEELLQRLAQPR